MSKSDASFQDLLDDLINEEINLGGRFYLAESDEENIRICNEALDYGVIFDLKRLSNKELEILSICISQEFDDLKEHQKACKRTNKQSFIGRTEDGETYLSDGQD